MKDRQPHPCIKCKEAILKRLNLCPICCKEIANEIKQHYEAFDKYKTSVLEPR